MPHLQGIDLHAITLQDSSLDLGYDMNTEGALLSPHEGDSPDHVPGSGYVSPHLIDHLDPPLATPIMSFRTARATTVSPGNTIAQNRSLSVPPSEHRPTVSYHPHSLQVPGGHLQGIDLHAIKLQDSSLDLGYDMNTEGALFSHEGDSHDQVPGSGYVSPHLIDHIDPPPFSNTGGEDVVCGLRGDDAQTFIEVMDQVCVYVRSLSKAWLTNAGVDTFCRLGAGKT